MLAVGTKTKMQVMSYKSMLIEKIKRYKDTRNYDLVRILKGPGRVLWTRVEEEKFKSLVK